MAEPPVIKAAKQKDGTYDFRGVFARVKPMLAESDYVVGNLETPLAGEPAGYSDTHLCFNAPDAYVDALIDAGDLNLSDIGSMRAGGMDAPGGAQQNEMLQDNQASQEN